MFVTSCLTTGAVAATHIHVFKNEPLSGLLFPLWVCNKHTYMAIGLALKYFWLILITRWLPWPFFQFCCSSIIALFLSCGYTPGFIHKCGWGVFGTHKDHPPATCNEQSPFYTPLSSKSARNNHLPWIKCILCYKNSFATWICI